MPAAPLDSAEDALNLARVRLNDAIQSLSGDILKDTAAFTLTALNGAWIRLQELLVNFGIAWLKPETVLSSVPLVTSSDSGVQVYLNWSNYFDGTTLQTSPVLPQNFIAPLFLWERQHSTAPTGSFFPMDRMDNGLPGVAKQALNKSWEWRSGSIYMPGATAITDLRIRYAGYFPNFVAPSTTAFSAQPIPIVRSLNALAWFICSEVSKARADVDNAEFDQKAIQSTKYMYDLEFTQGKSLTKESELSRMTDQYSATDGPAGPRGMTPK